MLKVILCADGDSRDIDLWSNIPYLLAAELERRGFELVRVNLSQPLWLRRLWRYTLGIRHKLLHWSTSYDFYRSRSNHWLTTRRLNQAVRIHAAPGTILINLSISSAPTLRSIPVVLLSDWSYHHYITSRLARQPDRSERGTIDRDHAAMARATRVVLLFPESARRLQRQIPDGQFRFLGHVINDHPLAPPPPSQPPASLPHRPWRLLFIGRSRYLIGLHRLVASLSLLPPQLSVQLDVIGISPADYAPIPSGPHAVHLHGYLSKADGDQRQLYASLVNAADLIVNASDDWGGFSATVEAMHRFTAVLTPRYQEFVALFGDTIPFGAYLSDLSPSAIAARIAELLLHPDQLLVQQRDASLAVRDFSWHRFVDRLLRDLPELPSSQT